MRNFAFLIFLGSIAFIKLSAPTYAGEFGPPVDCWPGVTCFIQAFPDINDDDGVSDPFCGPMSSDNHSGTDIRILTMGHARAGSATVIAIADGVVRARRDGVEDRIIRNDGDLKAVEDKVCGNGVIVTHNGGYESQYCHMRRGSVRVEIGDRIRAGEPLGLIGASGLASFPHLHLSIFRDGKKIDPATGRLLGDTCNPNPDPDISLWREDVFPAMTNHAPQILAMGLAGDRVEHSTLVDPGLPSPPTTSSKGLVAWAWILNPAKGDIITIELLDDRGKSIRVNDSGEINSRKATLSIFTGVSGAPTPGFYLSSVKLVRDGNIILERTFRGEVRDQN